MEQMMIVFWREDNPNDDHTPTVNDRLSPTRKRELQEVLEEFDDTLQNIPGRSTLAEHCIDVNPTHPIRLPPYCLPEAYRTLVKEELKDMEVE